MTLQHLTEVLQRTHDTYVELSNLGERKKQQLIHNQTNDLMHTLAMESKLLKRLEDLEKEREQALLMFQQKSGLPADPKMPLETVIQHSTNAVHQAAFRSVLAQLSQQAIRLKNINEANQHLVRQSLDFVSLSLDLLVGSPEDEMVYRNPGQAQAGPKRNSYFDTRA